MFGRVTLLALVYALTSSLWVLNNTAQTPRQIQAQAHLFWKECDTVNAHTTTPLVGVSEIETNDNNLAQLASLWAVSSGLYQMFLFEDETTLLITEAQCKLNEEINKQKKT